MGNLLKKSLQFFGTAVLIFLFISFVNLKTNGVYKWFDKLDLINRYATKTEINDIRDLFIPATNKRLVTNFIVLHCDETEMQNASLFDLYSKQKEKHKTIIFHYYITKKGKVYKLHNDNELTNHTENINKKSISVCLQGNFEKKNLTIKQYNSMIRTLILLQRKYPEALLIGHSEVNGKDICPGKTINMNEIRKTINGFHIFRNSLKYKNNGKIK